MNDDIAKQYRILTSFSENKPNDSNKSKTVQFKFHLSPIEFIGQNKIIGWKFQNTLSSDDKPLIITDGALNVLPNVKTKMHILKNVVNFSNRIGIERPKVSILSRTSCKNWNLKKINYKHSKTCFCTRLQ